MILIIPTIRSEQNNELVYPAAIEQAEILTLYDRNSETFTNLKLSEITGDTLSEKLLSVNDSTRSSMSIITNQSPTTDNFTKFTDNQNIDCWISAGNSIEEMIRIFELGGAFLHPSS